MCALLISILPLTKPVALPLGLALEKIDCKPLNSSGAVNDRASDFLLPCVPPLPNPA